MVNCKGNVAEWLTRHTRNVIPSGALVRIQPLSPINFFSFYFHDISRVFSYYMLTARVNQKMTRKWDLVYSSQRRKTSQDDCEIVLPLYYVQDPDIYTFVYELQCVTHTEDSWRWEHDFKALFHFVFPIILDVHCPSIVQMCFSVWRWIDNQYLVATSVSAWGTNFVNIVYAINPTIGT